MSCSGRFTGKERDSESGLDYFGARYYGWALGRFTSPDWSTNPQAVPYSDIQNPQSLNLYNYVRNNPLSGADPNGHDGQQTLTDAQVRSVGKDITSVQTGPAGQPLLGFLELYGAYLTVGASLEAQSDLSTAMAGIATASLAVSASTKIIGATTGVDPEHTDGAATAVQTITNPLGMAATLAKGDLQAGAVATDIANGVSALSNPKDAAKDPVRTTLTLGSVVQDVKAAFSSPPPPDKPLPPPAPKMCGNDACH